MQAGMRMIRMTTNNYGMSNVKFPMSNQFQRILVSPLSKPAPPAAVGEIKEGFGKLLLSSGHSEPPLTPPLKGGGKCDIFLTFELWI